MPFRFLHAADIHIDSPLRGLAPYEGAPVEAMRGATRRAFERLVETAIAEKVNLLLLAGDLYDGDWPDYRTGLFFIAQMARLRDARIPVFVVAGNHDARSVITKSLRLPDNVHLFSADAPETRRLVDVGVAIHGQSFAKRSVPDDLSDRYPKPVDGLFNIGLLHTSADGREGHDTYAPCSADGLAAKGYGYWALGHIHRREVLREEPWIVFSGNLQGRHARETGAKGATLVTVEGDRVQSVEPRVLDVVRWSVCEVDATGAIDGDAVLDILADRLARELDAAEDRPLCARVRVTGACRAHQTLVRDPERWLHEIQAAATTATGGRAWIEKVEITTRPERERVPADDALADLLRPADALAADEALVAAARGDLVDLARKLPAELRQGPDGLDVSSTEFLSLALGRATDLLAARLFGEEPAK